ncbi:MAG: CHAT domain-containing protein [Phormidium sp. GEM2.Bin31]|nr:MAG: CHAT domain-containing protein [Phormidium sp. GEM2.Bin31]
MKLNCRGERPFAPRPVGCLARLSNNPIKSLQVPALSVLTLLSVTLITPKTLAEDTSALIERWQNLEIRWEQQYSEYFGVSLSDRSPEFTEMIDTLAQQSLANRQTSAILYAIPHDEKLELILATSTGIAVQEWVPVTQQELLQTVSNFENELINPRRRRSTAYRQLAQQLHDWLISPVSDSLEAEGIEHLIFSLGEGLRTLPMAALHDGDGFLIETYSLGRIPGYLLMDTGSRSLRNAQVLAMGASEFEDAAPLPAVPLELASIVPRLWQGQSFLNEGFTLGNLQEQRQQRDYSIIHLATHAQFQPGDADASYLQFWDQRLSLTRLRELDWQSSPVELLVLSACSTARGDVQAELGFAGLAVQSGIPTVLASLWAVSDVGTLLLMSEFYEQLKTAPTPAVALRRSQLAALRGELDFTPPPLSDNLPPGTLVGSPLPDPVEQLDVSHPYYWSAFTNIGNPW